MKYVVITTKGTFNFEFGEFVASRGKVVCRDVNVEAHIESGSEVVALMRSDFAENVETTLAELERLQNQNGQNGH